MVRRWIVLSLVLPFYILALAQLGWMCCAMILSSNDQPFWEIWGDDDTWTIPYRSKEGRWNILAPAAAIALTQFAFLLPTGRRQLAIGSRGKPFMYSALGAAFVAAMLTAGLTFTVIEAVGLLANDKDPMDRMFDRWESHGLPEVFGWWPVVFVSWAIWSPFLIVFARRQSGPRWFSRVVGLLLAGTILEVLIVVPVDIMVRRRTNCYCGTGTAWALCLSICALIWISGPGVFLALTSKRRKLWFDAHCEKCGYDKGPSPGEKCPECGFGWTSREAASD